MFCLAHRVAQAHQLASPGACQKSNGSTLPPISRVPHVESRKQMPGGGVVLRPVVVFVPLNDASYRAFGDSGQVGSIGSVEPIGSVSATIRPLFVSTYDLEALSPSPPTESAPLLRPQRVACDACFEYTNRA